jgi:hypothetical protein
LNPRRNFFSASKRRSVIFLIYSRLQTAAINGSAEGLERLNDLGVVEEKSHHYLSTAAKLYGNTVDNGKKCLLLSPTHREIDTLNALARHA